MRHVHLYTPASPELSAGFIYFDVSGYTADEVVAYLREQGIVASTSPYAVSYSRVAPSLLDSEDDVMGISHCIAALT